MSRSASTDEPTSIALQPGQRLFDEGEASSIVYVVQSGRIELLKRQAGEELRVALLGGGDVLGEAQALRGGARPFSARAVDAASVLAVEADTLLALLAAHPDVAVALLRNLAPRLEAALLALVPPATVAVVLPAGACLVHADSGHEFPLPSGDEVRLGRADARSQSLPDIDLSEVDPKRSLSRRHARIVRTGETFEVFEEPRVTNGTFLNGTRLTAGERSPLCPGDRLRLGTVDLVFRAG